MVDQSTTGDVTTTTTTMAATTTTTTTVPPGAKAEFALSHVVFGELGFVIVTNWGRDRGSLAGLWLTQGSFVQALPDVDLAPGEQAVLGFAKEPPPDLTGMAAVVHLGPAVGEIGRDGGELALHSSDAFDDPASLLDYVAWAAGPHPRLEQAVAAGIWDEETVAVIDDAPSISTGIYPAIRAADWYADLGG